MRGGKEEVCVLEIVRPGMEDSESAKKQENTGIGPASACRGESAFTRVFHAPKARSRASFTRPKRVHARLSRAQSAFTRVFHAPKARSRASFTRPKRVHA